MTSLLFLLLVCSIMRVHTQAVGDSITVDLPFGSVKGYSNGDSWQFYGIPFAAPPVGDLRWQPPTSFTPWTGILDAKDPPAACIQNCLEVVPPNACAATMSEDCLYLNIFAPLTWIPGSNQSYNVLVYLHGGAFTAGTSGCLLFDSRFLSKFTDSIIVTLNYRLGALGYLRNTEFGIEGNMALRDQRMAMQWVKSYITYFGGNGLTTLFGESAGAISIGVHIESPLSKGLFDNVIIESNPWTIPLRGAYDANLLGIAFMTELGCFSGNCILTRSPEEILEAQDRVAKLPVSLNLLVDLLPWGPIIDDIDLSEQPFTALSNMANDSTLPPAIIGTTTDEGYLFVKAIELKSKLTGKELYDIMLPLLFPKHSSAVKNEYNSLYGDPVNYLDRLALIVGDYLFACSTRKLLENISNGDQKNVWNYFWNRGSVYNVSANFCYNRPCHESELDYVFGTVTLWNQQFTPNDLNLSRQVQTYWGNMADSNDPNMGPVGTGPYPMWPRYDAVNGGQMFFDEPIGVVSYNYRDTICNYLNTIGYEHSGVFSSASSVVRSSLLLVFVAIMVIGLIGMISSQ